MKARIRLKLVGILMFLNFFAFGQSHIDSLKSYVDTAGVNTKHISALIDLSNQFILNEPQRAVHYIKKADSLGVVLNVDDQIKALIYHNYSKFYHVSDNYEKALDYNIKAKNLFLKENMWDRVALSLMQNGRINAKRKKYENSLKVFIRAGEIYDSLGIKTEIGQIKLALGNVSYFSGDKDKALDYFLEAKALCEKFPSTNCWGVASNNIGVLYTERKMAGEAMAIYNELEKHQKSKQDLPSLAYTYYNMAEIWDELYDDDVKSAGYSKQALDIRLKIGNPIEIVISRLDYGRNMVRLRKYKDASLHLSEGLKLAEKESNTNWISQSHRSLAQLYDATGDYKNAYLSMKIHKELRDSIRDESTRNRILELETQYDTDKKEQEITLLELDKKLAAQELSNQKNITILSIIGGLIMVVFSGFLYRLLAQNKSQKQLLQQSIKDKDYLLREIHHRVKNNLQVISSLLYLQSEKLTDPVAQDAINVGRGRVKSMALIHQNLYGVDQSSQISLKKYLEDLAVELFDSYNLRGEAVDLELAIKDVAIDVEVLVPLGLIINELISNALKYAFEGKEEGVLRITANVQDDYLKIEVKDDGIGMKVDAKREGSFGTELIESFVEQLEADMTSNTDDGLEVNIAIPLNKAT